MDAFNILLVLVGAMLVCDWASAAPNAGVCPPKHKVYSNKTCHSDADCQKYGQICCPNQYNTKSCAARAPFSSGDQNNAKYGGSTSYKGSGADCNGVKCNPWEVCKPDPHTKRLRCQRP